MGRACRLAVCLMAITVAQSGSPKAAPASSAAVQVDLSAPDWTWTPWVQVHASTPEAWALAGVNIDHAGEGFFTDWRGEVQVGIGGAGNETPIATLAGSVHLVSFAGFYHWPAPALVDLIPAGSRVSVRARTADSKTASWFLSIEYLAHPLADDTAVSDVASAVAPSAGFATATTGASAWQNGAWVEAIASAADALVLGAVSHYMGVNCEFEIDVGVGSAGNEAVITTIRGTTTVSGFVVGPMVTPLRPLLSAIPAGSRVAVRWRNSTLSADNAQIVLTYFEAPTTLDDIVTARPQLVAPAAAAGVTVPTTSGWADGAWVEVLADVGTDPIALTGAVLEFTINYFEADIGVGLAGDEAVVATFRNRGGGNSDGRYFPLYPPRLISANSRVSIRCRREGTAGRAAITYLQDPDISTTRRAQQALPPAQDDETVAANTSTWGNSAWVEMSPNLGFDALLTALVVSGFADVDYEVDVGFGPGGSETVAATYRRYIQAGGTSLIVPLWPPLHVPNGTRVSLRVRKAGTSAGTWELAATYVQYDAPPNPARFTLSGAWQGVEGPIVVVELHHPALAEPLAIAAQWVMDPTTYHYGPKAPRILRIDDLTYAMSDRSGRLQVTQFRFELADILKDGDTPLVRDWLGQRDTRQLRRIEIIAWMIADRDRRLLKDPVIIFRGYPEEYGGLSRFRTSWDCLHWIHKYKDRAVLPTTIGELFPNAPAETRDLRVPLALGELSDEGSDEDPPTFVADETGRGGTGGDSPTSSYGDIGLAAPTTLAVAEEGGGNLDTGIWPGDELFVMATRVVGGVESDPEPFLESDCPSIVLSGTGKAIRATCDNDGADSYRFYLGYTGSGNFYWTQRLETNDPVTGVLFTDAPDPATQLPTPITSGATFTVVQNKWAALLAVMPDGRTSLAPNGGLSGLPGGTYPNLAFIRTQPYLRPSRLAWDPVPNALGYELYMADLPNSAFSRRFDIEADHLNGDSNVYWEWDWTTVDYENVDGAPQPEGKIPPIHVGTVNDSEGQPRQGFLISGRPGAAFISAYLGGTKIDPGNYDTLVFAPGQGTAYATFFGANPYYTVGPHKLFMVFLDGPFAWQAIGHDLDGNPVDQLELRVNIEGLEDVGNGSGTVIASMYQWFKKVANNLLLADTPTLAGAFDAQPAFIDETPKLDEDSLDDAELDAATVVPAGPNGGFWLAGDITVGDFIALWAASARALVGTPESGQLTVVVTNPNGEPEASVDARREIIDGSFEFRDRIQGYGNRVPYAYNPRYEVSGGYALQEEDTEESTGAQAESGETVAVESVQLAMRDGPAAARQIARSVLRESELLPRDVDMASVLHWLHLRLGRRIDVTHPEGPTATGWNEQIVQVLGKRLAPFDCKVSLTCLDLRRRVGELTWFLYESFMSSTPIGGSTVDTCRLESSIAVPINWIKFRINWDAIPATHGMRARIFVATTAGTIKPSIFLFGEDPSGDTAVVEGTTHGTDVLTEQTLLIPRPGGGGEVDYWMLPILAGGAVATNARMIGVTEGYEL